MKEIIQTQNNFNSIFPAFDKILSRSKDVDMLELKSALINILDLDLNDQELIKKREELFTYANSHLNNISHEGMASGMAGTVARLIMKKIATYPELVSTTDYKIQVKIESLSKSIDAFYDLIKNWIDACAFKGLITEGAIFANVDAAIHSIQEFAKAGLFSKTELNNFNYMFRQEVTKLNSEVGKLNLREKAEVYSIEFLTQIKLFIGRNENEEVKSMLNVLINPILLETENSPIVITTDKTTINFNEGVGSIVFGNPTVKGTQIGTKTNFYYKP